jgi:hypothetical protein
MSDLESQLQLATLRATGRLQASAPEFGYCLPDVWLESGQFLCWTYGTRKFEPAGAVMHPHVLGEFLKLETASDEQILRFAQTHGVLGLCEHGPHTHGVGHTIPWSRWILDCPVCSDGFYEGLGGGWLRTLSLRTAYCQLLEFGCVADDKMEAERLVGAGIAAILPREPLAAWRQIAGRLRRALRLASALRTGANPQLDDLQFYFVGQITSTDIPESRLWDLLLTFAESFAVGDGFVSLRVVFDDENRAGKLILDSVGLLGRIGAEFLSWICSPYGQYDCLGCGALFTPAKRRPDSYGPRGHYCDTCGEQGYLAPRRIRDRKRYARKYPEAKRRRKTA